MNEAIAGLPVGERKAVVVTPIGFVSDHMEVVYDLDRVAAATAAQRDLWLVRTPTPGTDPRFVEMVCDLVDEVRDPAAARPLALGDLGPVPCPCAPNCCPRPG